jgi:hypothetical protein
MSNITTQEKNMLAVESALVGNDISKLTTQEKMTFYNKICESVGLNPLTKPFAFLKLQGKEVLYATKDCTEQLRKIHGVSTQIISKQVVGDLFEVHVKARDKTGKEDEDISYLVIKGLSGNDLANAMMKGITKSKRRVTLSICGLGMLDESEIETIENVAPASNPQIQNQFKDVSPEALPPAIDQSEKIDVVEPTQAADLIADSQNPFDSYTINAGPKSRLTGTKLKDHTPQFLLQTIESSKKWHEENKRDMHPNTKEFVEMVNGYLKTLN